MCNFWRAIKNDPLQTAYWAEYPTIHQDLTARHRWLVQWAMENSNKLSEDPEYYDSKAAGWWVWGVSNWIGGGFCDPQHMSDKRPHVGRRKSGSGNGVQVHRDTIKVPDQRPHVEKRRSGTGTGVQLHRKLVDRRPHVAHRKGGGQGVQISRDCMGTTGFLDEWFEALAYRLRKVIVFNRDWTSMISPTILGNTKTEKQTTALFLDPPYLTSGRKSTLYVSDTQGTSDDTAAECYEWAVDNGNDYRIVYACHEGDFPVPNGWDFETATFGGIKDESRRNRKDMIMYSPACLPKDMAYKEGKRTLDRFFG